jgi:hypothetical protein
MIPNRPLKPVEKTYLNYWKKVCGECFEWTGSKTEKWVNQNVDDFDYDLPTGWLYNQHPFERIQPLFIPDHLREKFRIGKLTGLRDFYNGLSEILGLGRENLSEGFPSDFDWEAARKEIKRLTERFVSQNLN